MAAEIKQKENSSSWRSALPITEWLPQYKRSFLRWDIIAGITLAAYAVPVSLAYATLAGLPPQFGIYCYLVAGLFYAVLGVFAAIGGRPPQPQDFFE